jgi:hypothetical protein
MPVVALGGSRGGRKRRRQHVRPRYTRGAVAPGVESHDTQERKGSRRNQGELRLAHTRHWRSLGHGRKPRRRSCRGRGEESDGTCEAPDKADCGRPGGDGGKVAGRGEGLAANDVPGTVPDRRLTSVANHGYRNWMGCPSPEPRCRRLSTRAGCGKDARPESVRGSPRPYRDQGFIGCAGDPSVYGDRNSGIGGHFTPVFAKLRLLKHTAKA